MQRRKRVHALARGKTAFFYNRMIRQKEDNIMDVTGITQLIGSLGFPIAVAVYLLYQNAKNEEMHKEEMNKLTEAVNNNTVALTQLAERMNKE